MLQTKEEKIFQRIVHVVMILISAMILVPFILLVISSFTDNKTLIRDGYSFFAEKLSLENYTYILVSNGANIMRAYGMSFLVTAIGTALGSVMTVSLGYALSRPGLPARRILTFLVFFTMLFNGGLVPTYMNYCSMFGIKNTLWALIVPNLLMNGMNVMLVKSYFVTSVPDEILEAASIDGANEFKQFYKIAVPMARPIIATIALFVGLMYWNDWNNGYVYLSTATNLYTIQNLLNRIQQNIQFMQQNASQLTYSTRDLPSEGIRMAMAVLGVLPVMIIYPLIQKNFVKGITLGGIKG